MVSILRTVYSTLVMLTLVSIAACGGVATRIMVAGSGRVGADSGSGGEVSGRVDGGGGARAEAGRTAPASESVPAARRRSTRAQAARPMLSGTVSA